MEPWEEKNREATGGEGEGVEGVWEEVFAEGEKELVGECEQAGCSGGLTAHCYCYNWTLWI